MGLSHLKGMGRLPAQSHGHVEAQEKLAGHGVQGLTEQITGRILGSIQAFQHGVGTERGIGMAPQVGDGIGKGLAAAGIQITRQAVEKLLQFPGAAPPTPSTTP